MKVEKETITCRVCLQCEAQNSKFLSLFDHSNDYSGVVLADKINSIANVEIKRHDGLPDVICPDCLLQLENAIAFKVKCESSNIILHSKDRSTNLLVIEVKKEYAEHDKDSFNDDYYDVDLKYEIPIEEPPKKYKKAYSVICHDCGGNFKSKCKLRIHWRKEHQPDQLTCKICKRMFKTYRTYNIHVKTKPNSCLCTSNARIEGQGRHRVLHCQECTYKTKRPKDFATHFVIHTGDRKYICNKCPKAFTQQSSLQAHQEHVHKDYLMVTTCQYCGKLLKGRSKAYRHLKLHTQLQQQCEICKKFLKNKKILKLHMQRHSGVKGYSCEVCAQTFYTMAELCNHRKKVHQKLKSIKCDLCGYMVYTKELLKKHQARHTDTNVPCLLCGKFVENEQMLVLHQKRHYEKNYPCPHCEKSFFNRKSRSKHVCAKHKSTKLIKKVSAQKGKVYSGIKQECILENQCKDDV